MKKTNIQKVLITGMSFSGKSYVSDFMKKKGVNVVDADNIKGLGQWFDKDGNKVLFLNNANKEWLDNHDFLWDKDFLSSWIDNQEFDIYLFGLSGNVLDVCDLFDKTYYLDISPAVLKKRFIENKRSNPMGKTDAQKQVILKRLMNFAKRAKVKGLVFINANKSPEEICTVITG